MFRCLAKIDSLIFYIFPLLSPPLPFFLCYLQMLFIPCHHTLLPFKLVFPLIRPVAFLSFPVKYNNVFGLAFLPHFSSLRSTATVPHFQAFSCLFFFPSHLRRAFFFYYYYLNCFPLLSAKLQKLCFENCCPRVQLLSCPVSIVLMLIPYVCHIGAVPSSSPFPPSMHLIFFP